MHFDAGRRSAIRSLAMAAAAAAFRPAFGAAPGEVLARPIPSSGERIPAVGLGSWITFNVGDDPAALESCAGVIRAFFSAGGRLIDSSPMYGSSQATIGHALRRLPAPLPLFSADKVWTGSAGQGPSQVEDSRRLWGVVRFDLLQVHNLTAWEDHLPMLLAMKKAGRLRYAGVTTSHGRRHGDLEKILRSEPVDFVQLTYNPADREAERRLLPLAAERGIAVLVNRPFRQGELTEAARRHPLPAWAGEIGARSWAQLILKFILSHPAVTCVIPATSVAAHAAENVDAARGALPDAAMRRRIAAAVAGL